MFRSLIFILFFTNTCQALNIQAFIEFYMCIKTSFENMKSEKHQNRWANTSLKGAVIRALTSLCQEKIYSLMQDFPAIFEDGKPSFKDDVGLASLKFYEYVESNEKFMHPVFFLSCLEKCIDDISAVKAVCRYYLKTEMTSHEDFLKVSKLVQEYSKTVVAIDKKTELSCQQKQDRKNKLLIDITLEFPALFSLFGIKTSEEMEIQRKQKILNQLKKPQSSIASFSSSQQPSEEIMAENMINLIKLVLQEARIIFKL